MDKCELDTLMLIQPGRPLWVLAVSAQAGSQMDYWQFHFKNFTLALINLILEKKSHSFISNFITLLLASTFLRYNWDIKLDNIYNFDCFQDGDSFLKVLIVCDLQDRIRWYGQCSADHPPSHILYHTLHSADNYTISLSSHPLQASSIRSFVWRFICRHSYEHPSSPTVTWDLVTDGTFTLIGRSTHLVNVRRRGYETGASWSPAVIRGFMGKDSRCHMLWCPAYQVVARGSGWHQQMPYHYAHQKSCLFTFLRIFQYHHVYIGGWCWMLNVKFGADSIKW